ncbi:DUF2752 domain-containing protein [Splendidivirga corallicola]|uniref:DUF2752 domain-containing protein n=1 Tax=Splendidivirga corallicola TaxID=3051826 RepID=UPI003211C1BE
MLIDKVFKYGPPIIIVILVVLYFTINPSNSDIFPSCPFHKITGYYCPGCGSQRAFYQLLHLNPIASLKYNPLLIAGFIVLIYNLSIRLVNRFRTKKIRNLLHLPKTPLIIAGVIIVFWIARNIDYPGFHMLAP